MSLEEQIKNSILHSSYVESDRPISKNEIKDEIKKFMRDNKISEERVYHTKTKYNYYVKKFGKKEKEIIDKKNNGDENYNVDIGNCSVTWKISKTPYELRNSAKSIVNEYMDCNNDENRHKVNHFKLELMKVFYTWLYLEHYD